MEGDPPSYAGACKDIQQYAIACLCAGVKPANVKPNPKLKVIKQVSSEVVVTTEFAETTVTATPTTSTTVTPKRIQGKFNFLFTIPPSL